MKLNLIIDMLDAHVDFMIENINLKHQDIYLNDRIIFCVLHKSYNPRCYLAKGFYFTQKIYV